jgi:hypothetical protein
MYERFKIFFRQGLLTIGGGDWPERRRRVNPAFHRAAIENMTTVMTASTERTLGRWHAAALTGRPGDVLLLQLNSAGQLACYGLERPTQRLYEEHFIINSTLKELVRRFGKTASAARPSKQPWLPVVR